MNQSMNDEHISLTQPPEGYADWLADLKGRIHNAQQRATFPDMKGFSPRNLKYMRAFAEAWPDAEFVQQAAAQLPWGHNLVLLDRLNMPEERRWYAAKAIEHNWSRNVQNIQIERELAGSDASAEDDSQ